ncbi:hypothetical protein TSAR_005394 [Trichomalopsis sarcophagae]|uniref:Paramyosin n=1 Tax=Trichomalopsis sarcophagae TaxID=543379 RepID=A0A232ES19_9HYME|nr:hypothetical protein TSAR_005394 [Trichomalopsis sarcophagae]
MDFCKARVMGLKILPTLLILCLGVCLSRAESREITHEDIKDAMLSLVHMMRDNTEKLERHEARDRQTAEQLKKAISLLTKRMSSIDGLKAYFVKFDERVTGIEQLISQKDERERIQIQKTADSLQDLESRLEGWATEIESKVVEGIRQAVAMTPTVAKPDRTAELLAIIEASEAKLETKLETKLSELITITDTRQLTDKMFSEVQQIGLTITDVSQAVEKLQKCECTLSGQHRLPSNASDDQLVRVRDLVQSTLEQIRELPRVSELQTIYNETRASLQEMRYAVKVAIVEGNQALQTRMTADEKNVQESISSLRFALTSNSDHINQELHELGKGQSVMVEMADQVLDTKKRLEHAYKFLRELAELVMVQGLNINQTLNTRFDGISNDIMDNQNGALANLTVKMEQEMNQVWRQINVMYQQMMESAKALDKLHKQNEAYVNGTTSTMDGMESKVGEITKRMSEVDTNLNYLLGRLSLVTHEFNQIKQGLGAALDNIKASFKEVQEKANDLRSSPGPHPLPQDYEELGLRLEP